MTSNFRSSLQRVQGKTPASPEEIRKMAAAAWHNHHILLVPMDDPGLQVGMLDRQHLENTGNRLYGKRDQA